MRKTLSPIMVGKVEMLVVTGISSTLKLNFPSCGTSETEGSSSARIFNFAIKEAVRTFGIIPLLKSSPSFLKFTPNPSSSCWKVIS